MSGIEVDTIVSLSTAPGVSAIAVVRISGPHADDVLRGILGPEETLPPVRTPAVRELVDATTGEVLDRALVTRFSGPASFTGEDSVELSCHGGWIVPDLVLSACLRAGARQAEPGEFTRRAYLRGKLDLVQVEAIADVIEAKSRALHRAAIHQLDRNLSTRVSDLRERLVRLEALLAHHVDFPEEDEAPVAIEVVLDAANKLHDDVCALLESAPEGALLRAGAVVVLAGPPNAGKSSLFNALLGEDRAIVTPEAGTTRDALEAEVQLGGYPFRLVDTAGLREETGTIERLGIEVAQRYLAGADVVVVCVPRGPGAPAELAEAIDALREHVGNAPFVLVETKADVSDARTNAELGSAEWVAEVGVSAIDGSGLEELRTTLRDIVYGRLHATPIDAPIVTRRRHAVGLEDAAGEIRAFIDAIGDGLPAEVASTHLRSAETALEELLGVVSVDDVLDVVFRDFCIGK
ncbi:MAG: tRNA uridine-5-carboxymethylaminomethyl(34) synthesis GTPase MnmE [Gemmatimonadota bacterium]